MERNQFLKISLIEVWLSHSVLVSAVEQSESAVCMRMLPVSDILTD